MTRAKKTTQRGTSVRVIGLDPGWANIGVLGLRFRKLGVKFDFAKCIRTKPSSKKRRIHELDDENRRIDEIVDEFSRLLDEYQPDVVASERRPTGLRNKKTVAHCALAYGAMKAVVRQRKIPFLIYEPQEIKQRATGDPHASKEKVIRALKSMAPGFKDWPASAKVEHVADAGGAALCAEFDPLVEAIRRERT